MALISCKVIHTKTLDYGQLYSLHKYVAIEDDAKEEKRPLNDVCPGVFVRE